MSLYIKRKIRFPNEVTHKRNVGLFRMGLNALCGARGENVRMSTNSKHATCPACIKILGERRAAAREKAAQL